VFFRDFERDFEESASKSSGDEIFWNNWKNMWWWWWWWKTKRPQKNWKAEKMIQALKIKNSKEENLKGGVETGEQEEKEEENWGWRKKGKERVSAAAAAAAVRHTPASGDAVGPPLIFSGPLLVRLFLLFPSIAFFQTPREREREKRWRDFRVAFWIVLIVERENAFQTEKESNQQNKQTWNYLGTRTDRQTDSLKDMRIKPLGNLRTRTDFGGELEEISLGTREKSFGELDELTGLNSRKQPLGNLMKSAFGIWWTNSLEFEEKSFESEKTALGNLMN